MAGTKRCRGTSRMAWRTRSSFTPRLATWRSTMSARWCAYSRSCCAVAASFPAGRVAKELLERFEPLDRFMVGEVEVQRGDGDEAALHGLEVRSFARMPERRLAADPVVLASARIEALDDALGVDTLAELRHPHAGEVADGEVDVEDDLRIAVAVEDPLRQRRPERRATVERHVLPDEGREGDGGDVEQR